MKRTRDTKTCLGVCVCVYMYKRKGGRGGGGGSSLYKEAQALCLHVANNRISINKYFT